MKRIITRFLFLSAVITAVSCSKDSVTPDDFLNESAKAVKTEITLKSSDDGNIKTTSFATANVYRNSEFEGQSWFVAWSGGKMQYDCFRLSIYFQDVDQMKVGEALEPSRFFFSFFYSNNSDDSAFEYSGKITLAEKGEDYVILDFQNVGVSCGMGDYVTDGYLYCPLEEKYNRE